MHPRGLALWLFSLFWLASIRRRFDATTLICANVDGKELRLDFYQSPSSPRPAPCVIVIHGGSWRSGDSQQLSPLNTYLAARGHAIAAINYRLVPFMPAISISAGHLGRSALNGF